MEKYYRVFNNEKEAEVYARKYKSKPVVHYEWDVLRQQFVKKILVKF